METQPLDDTPTGETKSERKARRRAQRIWMAILNSFFMSVIYYVLIMDRTSSPAETSAFMSYASLITLNTAYLFGEIWEDLNITRAGIKV